MVDILAHCRLTLSRTGLNRQESGISLVRNIVSSLISRATAPSSSGGNQVLAYPYRTAPSRGLADLLASYGTTPVLRDVVSTIGYSVASVPWVAYKVKGTPRPGSRAVKHLEVQCAGIETRETILRDLDNQGRLERLDNHPVVEFLMTGSPKLGGFQSRRLTQMYLDMCGDAFWELQHKGAGERKLVPESYWVIPPHWVTAVPCNGKEFYKIRRGGVEEEVPAEDVVWFKDPTLDDPYGRGSGMGSTLSDEIATDGYASKFIETFFHNRAKPEAIVTFEGMGPEERERIEATWDDRFRGFWNAHRPWFSNFKVGFQQLTQKFTDMQMVDLRKAQRDAIGTGFGVPPEIRGIIENSNRATASTADYIFQSKTVVPRLEMLRQELQLKVVPLFDDRIVLHYVSPVPEDREHALEVMKASAWAPTRAEWREAAGLPDRGVGDDVHKVSQMFVEEPAPKLMPRKRIKALGVTKGLDEASIEFIASSVDGVSYEVLTKYQSEQLEAFGNRQIRKLGLSGSFDLLNPAVVAHLQDFATNRMRGYVSQTTKDLIKQELLQGVLLGESNQDLSKRIAEVFGRSRDYRSDRIARTETVRSSNFGTQHTYETSGGVVASKQWVATLVGNTRDTHLSLHAQAPIPIKAYFDIGGDKALYPGNFSRPENSINCRCTTIPVTAGPRSIEECDIHGKEYLDQIEVWHVGFVAEMDDVFDEQERLVKARLDEVAA